MAWRLNKIVVRGEIDNRIKGVVTGRIWLFGIEEPIVLDLEGNCLRDMAGVLLRFDNPCPGKSDREYTDLNPVQNGIAGDMTASRKVRVFDIPVKEAYNMLKRNEKPPEHLGNCLYLEWYSERNGRVVIESTDYRITVSEPVWTMDEEQEKEQRIANGHAVIAWMERLTNVISAAQQRAEMNADKEHSITDDITPMDEFAWEKFLKESDARTDKLMALEEKYKEIDEEEERERLIAREMGWTHIEEYLDANASGHAPEQDEDDLFDCNGYELAEPNPLTEGIDWVLDEAGDPKHPLYLRSVNVTAGFHRECKEIGLLGGKDDQKIQDLVFGASRVTVKLAGALNSLWTDFAPEPGFVVASLKRSLKYFNEMMGHYQTVKAENLVPRDLLERFHADMCSIREEILALMDCYRG